MGLQFGFEKLLHAQALPFPVEDKPYLLPHFCKYFMKTRPPPIENGSAPCHPNLTALESAASQIPPLAGRACRSDVGYYSADGRIFLCGRLKELIKCMDHQVAPEEIEEVLAADPEVRQVVVAGVPHLEYEEAARAFVVPQRRLEEALTEQQEADRLKELVAVRLSYHKHLHGGVEFLDSIPETEIGKHPRTFLRDAFVQRQKDDTGGHGGVTREEG
ncbi:hypothetical protein HPB52_012846 [Rhipicephalus sanguineus]|uniref:AMP-binding enzyme C-terminal domain-containing protein n=1 Tax=Rhipicephalus sanguineus TaxID=34632 RepID=A0A9D4T9Z9_RHISA|nr:hypothetical protein HPB52_012846 [Rhipicephalus sanguineus]